MKEFNKHIGIITLLISLLFLGALFSFVLTPHDTILAGWDTVAHFYNFGRLADFLGNGFIHGYDVSQLGGVPLFYFYTSFPYLLGLFIKTIGGSTMTLAFAWRILNFLIIIFSACSFWIFSRTFIPRKALPYAGLFAIWYAVYPSAFFSFGIGSAAVLNGGLFTSALGVSFSLLFLACLEKIRETGERKYFFLSIALFALNILSSLVVSVFLVFLWVFYFLSAKRPFFLSVKQWLFLHVAIVVATLLLLSFFIIPFVAYHEYQSARPQPFPNNNTGTFVALLAPFLSLITEYKNASVPFSGVANSFLLLGSLSILFFFVRGYLSRIKNEKLTILCTLFIGLILLQLFSYVISYILPFITIHYYRASPFLLIFFLVISLAGIAYSLEEKNMFGFSSRVVRMSMAVLIVGIVGWAIIGKKEGPPMFLSPLLGRDIYFSIAPYYADLTKYPDNKLAEEIVARILREKTQRVFVEGDIYSSYKMGSPHMIATMLNLKGRATLNGLLLESSSQADSLIPVYHGSSHTLLWGYGEDSLIYDFDFITQFRETLGRLRLFGVDYFIVHSQDAIDRIGLLGSEIEEVAVFNGPEREVPRGMQYSLLNYRIYRFKNPISLVRAPQESVGLFVDTSFEKRKNFKDFTKMLFARRELYNLPIAFTKNVDGVSKEELGAFDFFVVNGKTAQNIELMKRIQETGKQVLSYTSMSEELYIKLIALKQKGRKETPAQIEVFDGKEISFKSTNIGSLPWIVNLGYFPVWHSDRTVFEVSPGQMLVVAKTGESVSLTFGPDRETRVGVIISLISLIAIPFLVVLIDRRYKLFKRLSSH
ncbi:MAG: hypothetical protein WCV80_00100 [Candidatus Paceibacterota bacterium]|jgi:hypothetical protein